MHYDYEESQGHFVDTLQANLMQTNSGKIIQDSSLIRDLTSSPDFFTQSCSFLHYLYLKMLVNVKLDVSW